MSVFRNSNMLQDTIESVLSQSFTDFEFLIINDGSECQKVSRALSRYKNSDSRIRIVSKENEGLTKALIDGAHMAQGQYIARIDIGDIMLPNRLEKQLGVLINDKDIVMVSCWTEMLGPDWEALWVSTGKVMGQKEGFKHDVSHHGSVMFRTESYREAGGYRWQFYYGQDWDLWYRLFELGRFYIVPEVLYKARISPSSLSMTQKQRQENIAQLSHALSQTNDLSSKARILENAAKIRPDSIGELNQRSHAAGYYFIGKLLLDRKDIKCRKYFRQAFRLKPWNAKYFAFYLWSSVFRFTKKMNLK